jgi:RNA polymerase sigma factor (sigma-70 family)
LSGFFAPVIFFNLFSSDFTKTPFFIRAVITGQKPYPQARSPPPFSESLTQSPGKEVRNLKPQDKNHVRHMFDSYCKKVLKYRVYDYYRKMKRRRAREVSLSELSEQNLAKLSDTDEYFKDAYSFHVLGYDVTMSDEQIAEALNTLPKDRRDIILLSYFLNMTDREIAKRMDIVRSTVTYRRASTLRKLKKFMEGNAYE